MIRQMIGTDDEDLNTEPGKAASVASNSFGSPGLVDTNMGHLGCGPGR